MAVNSSSKVRVAIFIYVHFISLILFDNFPKTVTNSVVLKGTPFRDNFR